MGFLQRLRNGLSRFMYGRNGADQLGMCGIWTAIALDIVNMFLKQSALRTVLSAVSMVLFFWVLYRMFSKNLDKRRGENAWFLEKVWWPLTRGAKDRRQRRLDREHKYFTCPHCRTVCRVPVGKGSIVITCPRCGGEIRGKS